MHAVKQKPTPIEYISSLRDLFDTCNQRNTGKLIFNEEKGHFISQLSDLIQNSRIQCVDDMYLHTAFLGAAQLGLSFSKQRGQAFVISAFDGTLNQNVPSFFLGYKGMQALVARSKMVLTMTAEVVFEHDEFVFNGSMAKPLHRYEPHNDRGVPIGVYGISLLATGGVISTFMSAEELYAVEAGAKMNENGSWNGPFVNELRKKTGIRRHFKSLIPMLDIDIDDTAVEMEIFDAHYN